MEKPAPAAPPFDWGKLFQAAGLDTAQFQRAGGAVDAAGELGRARGVDRHGRAHRGEAAHRGGGVAGTAGLLQNHRAMDGGQPYGSLRGNSTGNSIPVLVIIYIVVIAACVLGWLNVRSGRADMRGAAWLAVIYFAVSQAAGRLVGMHHTATVSEMTGFWTGIGMAMVNGALNWVVYVALEPWVRRKWPRTMISWTRFTSRGASRSAGRARSFVLARCSGRCWRWGNALPVALHGNNGMPVFPPLDALLGVRAEYSAVLRTIPAAMFHGTAVFLHAVSAAAVAAQRVDRGRWRSWP